MFCCLTWLESVLLASVEESIVVAHSIEPRIFTRRDAAQPAVAAYDNNIFTACVK